MSTSAATGDLWLEKAGSTGWPETGGKGRGEQRERERENMGQFGAQREPNRQINKQLRREIISEIRTNSIMRVVVALFLFLSRFSGRATIRGGSTASTLRDRKFHHHHHHHQPRPPRAIDVRRCSSFQFFCEKAFQFLFSDISEKPRSALPKCFLQYFRAITISQPRSSLFLSSSLFFHPSPLLLPLAVVSEEKIATTNAQR